jgi:heme A synthase
MVFSCWPERFAAPRDGRAATFVGLGMLAVLGVSASGALTALGDTVYPVREGGTLAQLAATRADTAHFLERVRALHPLLAVVTIVGMLGVLPTIAERGSGAARHVAKLTLWLFLAQGAVGAVNVWLSAPGYMQVLHLFVTCLIWIALVLLAAELRQPRMPQREG